MAKERTTGRCTKLNKDFQSARFACQTLVRTRIGMIRGANLIGEGI